MPTNIDQKLEQRKTMKQSLLFPAREWHIWQPWRKAKRWQICVCRRSGAARMAYGMRKYFDRFCLSFLVTVCFSNLNKRKRHITTSWARETLATRGTKATKHDAMDQKPQGSGRWQSPFQKRGCTGRMAFWTPKRFGPPHACLQRLPAREKHAKRAMAELI